MFNYFRAFFQVLGHNPKYILNGRKLIWVVHEMDEIEEFLSTFSRLLFGR